MASLVSSLLSLHAKRQDGGLDYNSAPPNLSTLANNSIFETWRPKAHVLPPSEHIGDPCMHYTDPKTGTFHVGYLYSSDNTSGAAAGVTDDLVTYRDASSQASQKSGTTVDRYVSYVWLTNDNYGQSNFPKAQQGWDGSLLTARELSKGTIPNVVDNSLVHEKASWLVTRHDNSTGTVELTTLRQCIVRELYSAITDDAQEVYHQPARSLTSNADLDIAPKSKFYVMKASIDFPKSARGNDSDVKAGFRILESEQESTSIYYQFNNESMIIDRANSSAAAALTPGIFTTVEAGKLRLFDIREPSGGSKVETLDLTIIVDNAVVEVWANDRFVMSTWVWSWYSASNKLGFIVEGSEEISFGNVTVYEGLVDAWPERSG